VFVSSQTYFGGGLGGLAGADATCQGLADGAGPKGTFKAWLSADGASPSTRFTRSSVPYVLPDGTTVVANDWADLTSGSLQHAINMTEAKQNLAEDVWTSMDNYGEGMNRYCGNWISLADGGLSDLADLIKIGAIISRLIAIISYIFTVFNSKDVGEVALTTGRCRAAP
jgi:tetrahydromethanopterin S-methyltransferase subunit B